MAEEKINDNNPLRTTEMAVSLFSRVATQYRDKFMNVEDYSQQLDAFCNDLKQNAQVLELACGPGNITRYLLNRRPDLNILATDLSEEMLVLAREANPQTNFALMDVRDFKKLGQMFDGIICSFGLPYLSKEDAVNMIADASGILLSNSMLYISVMEDEYSKSGLETTASGNTLYIYYHQEDYLREAINTSGFNLVNVMRREAESGGKPVTELVLVARKTL